MNAQQRRVLSALTGLCQNTVRKWDEGGRVTGSVDIALTGAAKKAGVLSSRQVAVEERKQFEECMTDLGGKAVGT